MKSGKSVDVGPGPSEAANQRGVSGSKLTAMLVVALLVVGGTLSYALWSYSRVERARAATAASWQDLAEILAKRYRGAELQIAQGVDDETVDRALGERFRLALDRFRTSVGQPIRYQAALELETLIGEMRVLEPPSDEVLEAVARHNECLQRQKQVVATTGGRILSLFLNFEQPPEFHVQRSA